MKNAKITKEIGRLNRAIRTIEAFQKNEPSGAISYYRKNGKRYYRYRYYDEGEQASKHLSKKDARLIKKLATKKYYKKLLPVIRKELKLLEQQESEYLPGRKYEAYEELGELKEFVQPLFITPDEERRRWVEHIVDEWKKKPYTPYLAHPENLRFETNHGEFVRSKAEWMIANLLNEKNDQLLFRYEPEIILPSGKKLRPDFEIISLTTGKIYYWEHVGRLGDPEYVSQFIKKMNGYAKAGILPGENLILTFESGDEAIDVEVVKALINKYF